MRNELAMHRLWRGASLFFNFGWFRGSGFGGAQVFRVNWVLWHIWLLLGLARVVNVPLLLARLGARHSLTGPLQIFNVDQLVDAILILILINRHFVVLFFIWQANLSSLVLVNLDFNIRGRFWTVTLSVAVTFRSFFICQQVLWNHSFFCCGSCLEGWSLGRWLTGLFAWFFFQFFVAGLAAVLGALKTFKFIHLFKL